MSKKGVKLDYEGLIRLFSLFNGFGDNPGTSCLWWRTDEEYAPLTTFINCNDLFHWACADCEEVFIEDLDDIEQALEDCNEAAKDDKKSLGGFYADILWCCRKRKMRPQKPYYKDIDKCLHHLFDVCGPERDV